VANAKEEEGHVKGEEEEEECDGGTQSGEQQERSEDEPAEEEETKSVVKVVSGLVSANDTEATGSQNYAKRDPETTVGRESSCTECVADSHFPVSKLEGASSLMDVGECFTYHMPASN